MDEDSFSALLAHGLLLDSFMTETIAALARRQAGPAAWRARFMLRLHARVDRTEAPESLGADEFAAVRALARRHLAWVEAALTAQRRAGGPWPRHSGRRRAGR